MGKGNKVVAFFESLSDTLSSHSGAIKGILSAGVVTGINQLIEFAAFDCPCAEDKNLNLTNCSTQAKFCTPQNLNDVYLYGLIYIFAPATLLFLYAFIANKTFFENNTGSCNEEAGVKCNTENSCNALGSSTVAFVTWIVLSLIDGDYLVCSLTPFPYKFATGQTCKTPKVKLIVIIFYPISNTFLSSGESPGG